MGRRPADPDLLAPYPTPDKPAGLCPEASAWWDRVLKYKRGQIGPTDAELLRYAGEIMGFLRDYRDRLNKESAIRRERPELPPTIEEIVGRNYCNFLSNFVRLVTEMGLTPRSRKQVPPSVLERRKKGPPKTILDSLKPEAIPTFLPNPARRSRNGRRHAAR